VGVLEGPVKEDPVRACHRTSALKHAFCGHAHRKSGRRREATEAGGTYWLEAWVRLEALSAPIFKLVERVRAMRSTGEER